MRSFSQHDLMVEFVENLFEFNIEDRAAGSLGTWSSTGWKNGSVTVNWIEDDLSRHGIKLDQNSTFKVVKSPTNGKSITIGGEKDVKAWTELSDGPDGDLIATIGWTKIASKLFKELRMGDDIVWGKNTPALETAQCLGVYLDVDAALTAFEADSAKGRETWIPKIESVLGNGQDWNSAGSSTLKSKMKTMPDSNFLEMLFLAKGVKQFVDQYGSNLGSLHIIHGKIDDYYAAEEKNFKLGKKGKANTADFILANSAAQNVIDAVNDQVIKAKGAPLDYCYTNDGEKIKWYQISLKMAHGQLGKVTKTMKLKYKLPDAAEHYLSLTQEYLHNQGYELNEGLLSWAMDKVAGGLSAIKSISLDWFEKISEYYDKLRDWALGLFNSYKSYMPSGTTPTAYQIALINQVLVEDGRLKHGQLLNEARVDSKSINHYLNTTNQDGAQKIVKDVNAGIATIKKSFSTDDLRAYSGEGLVSTGSWIQKKGKKGLDNSWTKNEIIKIFANATAVDAFQAMIADKENDIKLLIEEQIDLAREIYFGKTQLPLFKVYGWSDTRPNTVERLGTAKEWTSTKLKGLTGDTLGTWPVIGFSTTLQKSMYYNISGGLIVGTAKDGAEPAYVLLAMRTNKADAFSFVAEASGKLTFDRFKTVFGL